MGEEAGGGRGGVGGGVEGASGLSGDQPVNPVFVDQRPQTHKVHVPKSQNCQHSHDSNR